jgi:hypothetical protein
MTSDHRITPGLIHDILDAPDRHRYARGDDLYADRAIGLIGDLARIWDGAHDHPATACPLTMPLSPPAYPGPSRHDARAVDQTADRILQAAPAVSASRTSPDRRLQDAAGREAGQ